MPQERFRIKAAVHLVLKKDNQILLLHRFQTGYMDGYYSLVSGHIEGDESLTAAMIREAQEEAGIMLRPEDLKLVHVMHNKSEIANTTDGEYMEFFFSADTYTGNVQNMEPEKCDELRWAPYDQLPDRMVPKVAFALEHIQRSNILSERGW